jgi:hypothetical protein
LRAAIARRHTNLQSNVMPFDCKLVSFVTLESPTRKKPVIKAFTDRDERNSISPLVLFLNVKYRIENRENMTISGIYNSRSPQEATKLFINKYSNTNTDNAVKNGSDNSKKLDFANITSKELLDWVNTSIKNGEITVDESGFVLLFLHRDGAFNLMEEMQ